MSDESTSTEPEPYGPDYRFEPPFTAGERDMLEGWLEFHRATLRWKLEGLTDRQLKERSVPPSGMSLLGLVRHMAEVERGWFRRTLAAEDAPAMFYDDANPDGDFDLVDDATVADDVATWQAEIDAARAIAAGRSLDDSGMRHGKPCTLRWVYAHMIEEYARHNGHADFLRERIDGTTGD
jgi:uncharacterized damage-inducible protein DinB